VTASARSSDERPASKPGDVPSVVVVSSDYELFVEIAAMLADSLIRAGAWAETARLGAALRERPDAIVLVGGHEFRSREVIAYSAPRPFLAYWALDPFPPPGITEETLRQGLRFATVDAKFRTALHRTSVVRSLVPSGFKRRVAQGIRRLIAGRRSLLEQEASGQNEVERAAYNSLLFVTRSTHRQELDHVIVGNSNAQRVLHEHGVAAACLPVGYHPWMGYDEGHQRDIDLAYLGVPVGERQKRLTAIEGGLHRSGMAVRQIGGWGSERAALLNRVKIVLNLSKCAWHPPLERFVFAAACGAMVLTETPVSATEPFVPGVHFVAAAHDEMANAAVHYLTHEDERHAIVEASRALIRTQATMDAVAVHLLSAMQE
jgi:Glycosyl transferases group 1